MPDLLLKLGQVVAWPPAPLGWAQVVELRTTTVRLLYRACTGRLIQPVVRADEIAAAARKIDPPLPMFNPFGRAIVRPKERAYALDRPRRPGPQPQV